MSIEYNINNSISRNKVRITIDEKSIVISKREAIEKAKELNLDLIEKSVFDDVAICFIGDYSKFKFDQEKLIKKQAKEAKKNKVLIKEIQLRPVTDINDISIKANKAQEFLNSGNKVKVSIKFKGRELSFINKGKEVLDKFFESIKNYKLENDPKMNGRDLTVIISKEVTK